ncbi:OLC1v1017547C1 [Oldenlandia corymbosa var. corymbosa]|uniref:OLC1v1017547C1 n=1 Tax=Oldenlandia corymbosa var. corymbosa TaxID=529605 RepID=A0AAV1E9W1_OLDCO|nr:OLC1v1017547C1 [Oldenlandia corymbosa var. corymbosa]
MVGRKRKGRVKITTGNKESRLEGENFVGSDGVKEKKELEKSIRVQQEEELERLDMEIETASSGASLKRSEVRGKEKHAKRQLNWDENRRIVDGAAIWDGSGAEKLKAPIGNPIALWYFVVRFKTAGARDEVFNINIRHFGNKPLSVKPWSVGMGLNFRDVDKVPVWIQLHGLELKYWNLESLGRLASTLGYPIQADEYTITKSRVQYARILVEMVISENVPDRIVFEDEIGNIKVQNVVYEWTPTQCMSCHGYGHKTASCRLKKKVEIAKPKTPSSEWKRVVKGKEVREEDGEKGLEIAQGSSQPGKEMGKELSSKEGNKMGDSTLRDKGAISSVADNQVVTVRCSSFENLNKVTSEPDTGNNSDISCGKDKGILIDPRPVSKE